MKSVAACSSWVYVEQVVDLIVDKFEDMGVACDEDFGLTLLDFLQCFGVVVAWIAANVGHQHSHLLALEVCKLGVVVPYRAVVYISKNGFQRLEGSNLVSTLNAADVARVPNLVYISKK